MAKFCHFQLGELCVTGCSFRESTVLLSPCALAGCGRSGAEGQQDDFPEGLPASDGGLATGLKSTNAIFCSALLQRL
jgi:hypothetical protein